MGGNYSSRKILQRNTSLKMYSPIKYFYKITSNILKLKGRCIEIVSKHLPLQNKVVFCNHIGKGFGDDPKYIALSLLHTRHKVRLIWMTKDLNIDLPTGIEPVLYGSLTAKYHLYTSKVWVFNYKNSFKVEKRPNQYYIQTWHGNFALKKIEKDIEDKLSEGYIRDSKKDSSMIDLMYSNNEFKINIFKKSFWYKGKVIHSGSPQLSILINTPQELRAKVVRQLSISENKRFVLYAPTFRNNEDINIYKFDYARVLQCLKTKFNSEFIMLIRLHPNISEQSSKLTYSNEVINATNYPDMNELMSVSDVMLTDFSGVAFDFMLKNAPVFLYAPDYDSYVKNERDLYFSYEETPFSFSKSEQQLLENIKLFSSTNYAKKVNDFKSRIGMEENGHGDENIANIITERIFNS